MNPQFILLKRRFPLAIWLTFDFIHSQYLLPQKERFTDFARQTTSEADYLSYTVTNAQGDKLLKVEDKRNDKIEMKVTPIGPQVTSASVEEAKQDIVIALQMFKENARKATMYFAWREGEEIVPEAYTKPENRLIVSFWRTADFVFRGLHCFWHNHFYLSCLNFS